MTIPLFLNNCFRVQICGWQKQNKESDLTIIIADLRWKTDVNNVSINNMIRPVFIHVSTTPVKVFLLFKGLV